MLLISRTNSCQNRKSAGSWGGLYIIPLFHVCSHTVKMSAVFPVHVVKYENDKSRDLWTPASRVHSGAGLTFLHSSVALALLRYFHLIIHRERLEILNTLQCTIWSIERFPYCTTWKNDFHCEKTIKTDFFICLLGLQGKTASCKPLKAFWYILQWAALLTRLLQETC